MGQEGKGGKGEKEEVERGRRWGSVEVGEEVPVLLLVKFFFELRANFSCVAPFLIMWESCVVLFAM